MKCSKKDFILYAITDRRWLNGKTLCEQVESAIKGGVTIVQLREKSMSRQDFLSEAVDVKRVCSRYGVPLIINDSPEIAVKVNADGVHIGQNDTDILTARKIIGENKILGVSSHSVKEAVSAEKNGADYLGAGAVFNTGSKSDTTPLSMSELRKICTSVSIPVVAIGGISLQNIDLLSESGASGVAVISAVFAQPDVKSSAHELYSHVINWKN